MGGVVKNDASTIMDGLCYRPVGGHRDTGRKIGCVYGSEQVGLSINSVNGVVDDGSWQAQWGRDAIQNAKYQSEQADHSKDEGDTGNQAADKQGGTRLDTGTPTPPGDGVCLRVPAIFSHDLSPPR